MLDLTVIFRYLEKPSSLPTTQLNSLSTLTKLAPVNQVTSLDSLTQESLIQGDSSNLNSVIYQLDEYAWQHGLNLLLNAADLEFSTKAIFIVPTQGAISLSNSLFKQFKQLSLYEIDSYICYQNVAQSSCDHASIEQIYLTSNSGNLNQEVQLNKLDSLDFLQPIDCNLLSDFLAQSKQIITV